MTVTHILQKIKEYKLEEIAAAKSKTEISFLKEKALDEPPALEFESALRNKQNTPFRIIAEIKKASPSKGVIRQEFNVRQIAHDYEKGGATCLSVLTDFPSFMGQLNFIKEARKNSSLPILRKDFLYDPYQVVESRAIGADCILIIMATVSDQQAKDLEETALHWGLDVLIEVHNEQEVERALQLKSKLIGINNRDLKTFKIDLGTTLKLAKKIPNDYLIVSESGFHAKTDLAKIATVDVKSFLIGESLMRQKDIIGATARLLS